jgi:hypothetical protein
MKTIIARNFLFLGIILLAIWSLNPLYATDNSVDHPQYTEQDIPTTDWMMVRITVPGPTAPHVSKALSMGFILAAERPPVKGFFDLLVPEDRLPELGAQGWTYVVRKEKVPINPPVLSGISPPEIMIPPEYHTYEEMTAVLDSLSQAYPEIAFMESLGVSTLDKRIVWGFKVSDNVETNEDEPAVLYVSTHHGCEMIGMEYCLYLIDYLLSNYGIDPQATRWIDKTEIWFVPLFNPDGYWAVYTDINHEWRKNARDTNNNGIFYEFEDTSWTADHDGIDLNRNYDFNWEFGGSPDSMSSHYRGAFPFSEDENQSMQKLATREMFQMAISFHSWGEVVIYPWDTDWNGENPPDFPVIVSTVDTVAGRIPTEDRTDTYYPYTSSAMGGYIDNWIYATFGTICMTLEVNPAPIFIEPGDSILPICGRLFSGTTYLLDRVQEAGVTGVVTDSSTGLPIQAEVRVLEYYADYLPPRTTDETTGRYYHYLMPWEVYTLEFISDGYDTVTVVGVIGLPDTLTTVNVAMSPPAGIGDGKDPVVSSLPRTMWLGQNYPNPFNPMTTIMFDIPDEVETRDHVEMNIFNLRGRLIRTLINREVESGRHSVTWDGRNDLGESIPSGIYFYTLKCGSKTQTRKMAILK